MCPVASGKITLPPSFNTCIFNARAPCCGTHSRSRQAAKPARAANIVIGSSVVYKSSTASPFVSVVVRFHVLFGKRASRSTSGSDCPAERTVITVCAGLVSSGAAGMISSNSELSITRYSGSFPVNPWVSRRITGNAVTAPLHKKLSFL